MYLRVGLQRRMSECVEACTNVYTCFLSQRRRNEVIQKGEMGSKRKKWAFVLGLSFHASLHNKQSRLTHRVNKNRSFPSGYTTLIFNVCFDFEPMKTFCIFYEGLFVWTISASKELEIFINNKNLLRNVLHKSLSSLFFLTTHYF